MYFSTSMVFFIPSSQFLWRRKSSKYFNTIGQALWNDSLDDWHNSVAKRQITQAPFLWWPHNTLMILQPLYNLQHYFEIPLYILKETPIISSSIFILLYRSTWTILWMIHRQARDSFVLLRLYRSLSRFENISSIKSLISLSPSLPGSFLNKPKSHFFTVPRGIHPSSCGSKQAYIWLKNTEHIIP